MYFSSEDLTDRQSWMNLPVEPRSVPLCQDLDIWNNTESCYDPMASCFSKSFGLYLCFRILSHRATSARCGCWFCCYLLYMWSPELKSWCSYFLEWLKKQTAVWKKNRRWKIRYLGDSFLFCFPASKIDQNSRWSASTLSRSKCSWDCTSSARWLWKCWRIASKRRPRWGNEKGSENLTVELRWVFSSLGGSKGDAS